MSEVKLYLGDCLDILPTLEAGAFDLCFIDPPYNIGIFSKMPPGEYLDWCERWIAEASRALAANGALWVVHKDPRILGKLSEMIERHGRRLVNWVTWDKYNGAGDWQGYMDGFTVVESLRSFQVMAEYLVYHTDEGDWTAQCDRERGFIFEPLRAYLDGERRRAGVDKVDVNVACGFSPTPGGMASRHYFSRSQWQLPTAEHYAKMQELFNLHGNHGGEYLRREYEDLRREYKDLRYTFNNPGKVSSVWQIPPAPRNGHPTPKPPALLRRIIETTTNPGDLVLDPMCGSGTTGEVCFELGRDCVMIEIDPDYFAIAEKRIKETQEAARQMELAL